MLVCTEEVTSSAIHKLWHQPRGVHGYGPKALTILERNRNYSFHMIPMKGKESLDLAGYIRIMKFIRIFIE